MKLKSLPLNNIDEILYIGVYNNNWSQVIYQDKHCEIYDMSVTRLLKIMNNNQIPVKIYKSSYHSPIQIGNTLFSPTANIKQNHCEYFNLLKVEDNDEYYMNLLLKKQLLDKAKRRFIEYKTKQILENEQPL